MSSSFCWSLFPCFVFPGLLNVFNDFLITWHQFFIFFLGLSDFLDFGRWQHMHSLPCSTLYWLSLLFKHGAHFLDFSPLFFYLLRRSNYIFWISMMVTFSSKYIFITKKLTFAERLFMKRWSKCIMEFCSFFLFLKIPIFLNF